MPDTFDVQAEEKRIMDQGRAATHEWMLRRFMQPNPKKRDPLECRQGSEPLVYLRVKSGFTITLDDYSQVQIGEPGRPGVYQVPKSIAEHFYTKANKAEIVDAGQVTVIKSDLSAVKASAEKLIAEKRAKGVADDDEELIVLAKMLNQATTGLAAIDKLGLG